MRLEKRGRQMCRLYFQGSEEFEEHIEPGVSSDDEAVLAAQGQSDGRCCLAPRKLHPHSRRGRLFPVGKNDL